MPIATALNHTFQVIRSAQTLFAQIQAAETGQRGYILTQRDDYLAPYNRAIAAIPTTLSALEKLLAPDPSQSERLKDIAKLIQRKLTELAGDHRDGERSRVSRRRVSSS